MGLPWLICNSFSAFAREVYLTINSRDYFRKLQHGPLYLYTFAASKASMSSGWLFRAAWCCESGNSLKG